MNKLYLYYTLNIYFIFYLYIDIFNIIKKNNG